jgi:hypothetical protein
MLATLEDAITSWREADFEARTVEALLAQSLHDFTVTRGPAISDVLIQEVAKARSKANDRLTVALAMIKTRPK